MSSPFIKRASKNRLGNIRQRSLDSDNLSSSSPVQSTSISSPLGLNDPISAYEVSSLNPASTSRVGRDAKGDKQRKDQEEQDEGEESPGFGPMQLAAQQRKKEKERSLRKAGIMGSSSRLSSSSSSRLSFGGVAGEDEEDGLGDEEGPASSRRGATKSQRKKVGLGLGLGSSALAASPAVYQASSSSSSPTYGFSEGDVPKPGSTSTSTSTYTAAYLQELKASTPSRGGIQATGDQSMVIDDEDDLERENNHRENTAGMVVQDMTSGIPNEALIASAKAKRAAAASGQSHAANDDFISLSDSPSTQMAPYDKISSGQRSGPHPESRLQREEDELGEGDDDLAAYTESQTTIPLGRSTKRLAARRLKHDMKEMIDDRENEVLENEDEMQWERAQTERAAAYGDLKTNEQSVSRKVAYKPARIPISRPIPTVGSASTRIQQSLALLNASKKNRMTHIATNEKEIANLDQQEQELREEVTRVEEKREWMQEFRGWVEMLGGFLEEKIPILEQIEADMEHHYKERAEMVNRRRKDDDADDLALFVGVARNNGNINQAGELEVDEMGRIRSTTDNSRPQSGARKYRREARQRRREHRRISRHVVTPEEEDGFSTDSSLGEADAEDYDLAQQNLVSRVKSLSDDVKAEEFRDPNVGLATRFGDWRKKYNEEYMSAYGGLAMVQAWEYWARKEMVGWEPSRSKKSLDSFKWFHALHNYSRPKADHRDDDGANGNENEDSDEDMDIEEEPAVGLEGDLVTAMVSSTVTKNINAAIQAGAYDIYSLRQTRILVDLLDMVTEYTGKQNSKTKTILGTILSSFVNEIESQAKTVQESIHPNSIPPPDFDPSTRSAVATYTNKRIKLIKNILAWKRFAPSEVVVLANKTINEVISPALNRSWNNGGKEAAMKVSFED